jgi:dolichyl-phosphate beta-glucosyltransferase
MPIGVSVIIPAFNEAARLGPTLGEVERFLSARGESYEIVVVDDGSTDKTSEVARRFAVTVLRQEPNAGKGAALRRGVLASRGDRVLLCDADLSTPIGELERLEARLAEAELVVGSRGVADSRVAVRQPWYRETMGRIFNLLVRMLAVPGIRDTQCGFKLIRGDVARELFARLTVTRFAYDVELLWLARRAGYRVVEVGVEWHNSTDSRVHALRDSTRMLLDLLRLRLRRREDG